MKNIFWGLLFSVVLFGCLKNTDGDRQCSYTDSQTIAPDSQVQKVKAYLDSIHITAQKHSSGFYYTINSPGTGAFVVNLCSIITVTYKAKLTNGTTFDSTATNATASVALGGLILGWQKGIPLVSEGGNITLYIPPALGYGSQEIKDRQGNVIVPANSILVFNVEVVDISG